MQDNRKHIIVYTFHSLEDPLVKGLILQYLLGLSASKKYIFHLITFEQPQFKLSDENAKINKERLYHHGVAWYPIDYHNGKFLLLKKGYDFLKAAWICFRLKIKFKSKTIIGFLPIAAAFSALLAPILRLKLIVYCFEPHSEYMIDFKIWNKKSLKYILLKKYETLQLELAEKIIVPTFYTKTLVLNINPRAKISVLPISVDTGFFKRELEERNKIRNELNLYNKIVVLYLGKFNGIYYSVNEVIDFFVSLKNDIFHFVIISPDFVKINEYISTQKNQNSFSVLPSMNYEDIRAYISAADFGFLAVPGLPSQKYRTPVKTGLYLSCELPIIVNKGVSEDDLLVEKYGVGIILDDIYSLENTEFCNQLIQMNQDTTIQKKCRDVALNERSHENAINLLNKILVD